MVAGWAVVELEAAAREVERAAMLEELVEAAVETTLEGVSTLLGRRVVRVVAVVEPLTQLCSECQQLRLSDMSNNAYLGC